MDDPERRAQLEKILERRRREGRSGTSNTGGSQSGLSPATFPPPVDAASGTPSNRLSAAMAELDAAQHNHSRAQSDLASKQETLSRRERELEDQAREQERRGAQLRAAEEQQQRLQSEVLRQVELQKSIASASENQLLWQQEQLNQQLALSHTPEAGATAPPDGEERLRRRLAEREARVAARLAQQEGGGGSSPSVPAAAPAPAFVAAPGSGPGSGSAGGNPQRGDLEHQLRRVEDENKLLRQRLAEETSRPRQRSADDIIERFSERVRQSSSPAPGARQAEGWGARNDSGGFGSVPPPRPPPQSPVAGDDIFDFSGVPNSGGRTPRRAPPAPQPQSQYRRPPAPGGAADAAPPPPPPPPFPVRPAGRVSSETPQDHMLMSKHAYVAHPVWDPHGTPLGAPAFEGQQGEAPPGQFSSQGPHSSPPREYQFQPPGAAPAAPPPTVPMVGPGGKQLSVLEQTELRDRQVQQHQQQHQMPYPYAQQQMMPGQMMPGQMMPGQMMPAHASQRPYGSPSHGPSYGPGSADASYAGQRSVMPGPGVRSRGQQFNMQDALNDLKAGDWFIKWTKSDKHHLRWFWLSWKKMMLFWSNTQSASMLMANNILLEEVVNLRSEQLTEEVPEDPGRPQVYYMICIKTYKRQLNIATRTREKFDKWYLVLDRLTKDYRDANEKAYQQPHPALQRVLQQPNMRQRAAGAHSAAD
eukprot:Hpha_TRINITY_DN16523_c3_g2::TRINITY_DN16523_c3_g2_i1::g.136996::m.136996